MLSDGMDIPRSPVRTEPVRRVLPSRPKEREERSREDFRELVEEEKEDEEKREEEERKAPPPDPPPEKEKKKTPESAPRPPGVGDRLDLLI